MTMQTIVRSKSRRVVGQPADCVHSFLRPMTPELRREIGRLRREARDEIDRLVAFLDVTDGECDLEDGGDYEPSLGWTSGFAWGNCLGFDAEDTELDESEVEQCCEDEGAQCDDEGCDGGDRESDMAEWGVADFDGVAEQFGRGGRFGEGAF